MAEQKIPIGISSCLLGEQVRFDGGHKRDSYIVGTLSQYFEFHPICPEVGIGLGVPRPPIRLVEQDGQVLCVGIQDPSQDFSKRLSDYAEQERPLHSILCGYILKKDSPSCGMERVKIFSNKLPSRKGTGIYAATLMRNNPLLPVEEEGRLGDPQLRENFIQRVYVLHRWRRLLSEGLSGEKLIDFHARHKLIIMSRGDYRELGRLIANLKNENLIEVAEDYISKLMPILKKVASRKQHVNVLQHIQGYLKKPLSSDDKAELCEVIERYRLGEIPLIVPLTLLKHHFRKCPDPYIENSWYLSPYPRELQLLNQL
ncbi:MAG: YbgA family protein [Gammaproteobacteria bacterium]